MSNSAIKILIVEDEVKVAGFIKQGLDESGFICDIALNGISGCDMAVSGAYDLIILDINLPLRNGFEVCSELRKNNILVPILILTAHGTTDEKVHGFEVGADDYLIKPFEFRELLARIKALLKRTQLVTTNNNLLIAFDLEINLDSKTVKRGTKSIDLTNKEFLLLEYFVRNNGRVLSRAEIAEKIWNLKFDSGTNVIDVYVNFLRKKIDQGYKLKLIHTKIGMGYYFKDITDYEDTI